MIPSFGAKKFAPAFQVKQAPTTTNNSSNGSIKNLSNGSTPGNPTTTSSIETAAPLTTSATTPRANQPQQAPHLRQAEAGACSSDDDFEKENIVVDQKNKKQAAKVKKPKAKKDPDAPKRPLSAYMFFCAQVLNPLKASLKLNLCQSRNAKKCPMNWVILVFRQYQQRFQEGTVSDHLGNINRQLYTNKIKTLCLFP